MSKSVKQAVFQVLKQHLEIGLITNEQLLNPRQWGGSNDLAMIVRGFTIHGKYTNETVREETVLRYVRQFKTLKRKELESQKNTF